jgi:hypothetical protein
LPKFLPNRSAAEINQTFFKLAEPVIYPTTYNKGWAEAWSDNNFKVKILAGVFVFAGILLFLPHFFSIIEARQGIVLNDRLLHVLPSLDFSVLIFILVWATSLLVIVRSVRQPAIFLKLLYLLIVITIIRITTISLFALDPPPGLIPLKDPLTSLTYGGKDLFITKDLFFSGHTCNLLICFMCLQKKRDKQFALCATMLVGCLVLIQHVHYTIDVVAALIFSYGLGEAAKRLNFFKV